MGPCAKLCEFLVQRSLRDTDTPDEQQLKELAIPAYTVMASFVLACQILFLPYDSLSDIGFSIA
eukprot:gene15223-18701_t